MSKKKKICFYFLRSALILRKKLFYFFFNFTLKLEYYQNISIVKDKVYVYGLPETVFVFFSKFSLLKKSLKL